MPPPIWATPARKVWTATARWLSPCGPFPSGPAADEVKTSVPLPHAWIDTNDRDIEVAK
ncbi:hypothetical protein GCM10010106_17180 [Thermopolyspora flexuosa]|uniref:hypothetical protein n=1 Tax=Thermopolyspora flexuosa TaxID=103836 RepID=UPI00147697B2|nr:hypothetical protein [Thermopolyspora flexuosa]GGM71471.1 hypothetical protein GCM10010106_17180 [Thermopolyspora flexuosa]